MSAIKTLLDILLFIAMTIGFVASVELPDAAAPAISWEIVQPGILGVTADDPESMPARLEVSLDGGQTWQVTEYPTSWATGQVLTPSVTWNVNLSAGTNLVEIRATDKAGNTSQAVVEISND